MFRERIQDLSIYYWLKNLFASDTIVTIVDDFPVAGLVLPTVAVEAKTIRKYPFEMGNPRGIEPRIWFIDVFGKTKSQRDDLGYKILNEIEDGIPVYDYDQGFPPDVSPAEIGCLIPSEIKMEIIRVIPELVTEMYWRATISFVATYSSL